MDDFHGKSRKMDNKNPYRTRCGTVAPERNPTELLQRRKRVSWMFMGRRDNVTEVHTPKQLFSTHRLFIYNVCLPLRISSEVRSDYILREGLDWFNFCDFSRAPAFAWIRKSILREKKKRKKMDGFLNKVEVNCLWRVIFCSPSMCVKWRETVRCFSWYSHIHPQCTGERRILCVCISFHWGEPPRFVYVFWAGLYLLRRDGSPSERERSWCGV